MRIVLFCHSLRSDWNHGNAHFLRGITTEFAARGHDVRVFEPAGGWSAANLEQMHGESALEEYQNYYPAIQPELYDSSSLDVAEALDGAQFALVHEWNDPELVTRIGEQRAKQSGLRVFFHDTHHRTVTDPGGIARYDLSAYDGVLAFGESVAARYREMGWGSRVWVWHEAADTRVFHPLPDREKTADLVWIGNWGDDERTAELREYLIGPVADLGLKANVYGVRYPEPGIGELARAGIAYHGWLPNFRVPEVFAAHRVTMHIPRGPYASKLRGIPTIRMFEALACGIPLISAPWDDSEGLFPSGSYLRARNGEEMRGLLRDLLHDFSLAAFFATNGVEAILKRHTCAHRVQELLTIYHSIAPATAEVAV